MALHAHGFLLLEHGFAGASSGSVRARLHDEDARIVLTVSDDGAGLPDDFQVDSSLGLQIVKTLVTEDLRGEFTLRANEGRGITATVSIPKPSVNTEPRGA